MAEHTIVRAGYKPAGRNTAPGLSVSRIRTGRPQGGNGYLAGTFPDGITSVEGVPTKAVVRVLYRPEGGQPGDGYVMAEVESAEDGSWRVEGLDPNLYFDVVGRKFGFNDVIVAGVRPSIMLG